MNETKPLPYKLACLCDLRDEKGRILLIERHKAPNQGLCSPIGGKLDTANGESPHQCARREIMEEAGIDLPIDRLHLLGLISERAFEGSGHWLMFYFRVLGPVEVPERDIPEGRLRWFEPGTLASLPLPETDRMIIWPLVTGHDHEQLGLAQAHRPSLPGLFCVHIDCRGDRLDWNVEQTGREP
ncbi:MAG: NUDIX domain-containing protein [Phycisphaeraceae bacterium]|nr:NUDIX domain-containing protein [Phycisphaeraceae bacterium]